MKHRTILLSLLVVSITLIGFLIIHNTTSTPLTFTYSAKPTVHVVYPSTSIVTKSQQVISDIGNYKNNQITQLIQNTKSKPLNIQTNTELLLGLVQKAEAISSTQSTIMVTSTSITPFSDNSFANPTAAVDSSGNIWGFASSYQVARWVPSTQVETIWTLPHGDTLGSFACLGSFIATDSMGNAYFQASNSGQTKLERLDPSTNLFTEWDNIRFACGGPVLIDSSDNFYSNIGLESFNPSTNTLTEWSMDSGSCNPTTIDSINSIYGTGFYNGANTICRFVPSTNTITSWAVSGGNLASDSSGNIFFFSSGPDETSQIGELSTSTNTVTEWTIPSNISPSNQITVDSSDNVFFTCNGFCRFVPSTGSFTLWSDVSVNGYNLKSTPQGVLTFSGFSSGTIS